MMHIEYRAEPCLGSVIEIVPENKEQIPELLEIIESDFIIRNPRDVFQTKRMRGDFENSSPYNMSHEAEMASLLSEIWTLSSEEGGEQPALNIMEVLGRLMQMYLDAKWELMEYEIPFE